MAALLGVGSLATSSKGSGVNCLGIGQEISARHVFSKRRMRRRGKAVAVGELSPRGKES